MAFFFEKICVAFRKLSVCLVICCPTFCWAHFHTSNISVKLTILVMVNLKLTYLKQLTARTEREQVFFFSLKCRYVGHFVHYESMYTREYYGCGRTPQVGRPSLALVPSGDGYWSNLRQVVCE